MNSKWRGRHSVYIKEVDIPTSFAESRDWFELFFDDVFAPPKLFNIVIQWLVCSSVHMVHFVSCLFRIAEKHGFSLIRLPIAVGRRPRDGLGSIGVVSQAEDFSSK